MFNVVLQNGGAAVSILRFYFSTTHKNTATGSKGFIMHDNCLIFIYIYKTNPSSVLQEVAEHLGVGSRDVASVVPCKFFKYLQGCS